MWADHEFTVVKSPWSATLGSFEDFIVRMDELYMINSICRVHCEQRRLVRLASALLHVLHALWPAAVEVV